MGLSGPARALLVASIATAVLVYLVIVELGVNAGRIHYRVSLVGGVDLGGLTEDEARAMLLRRAQLLSSGRIHFGAEGIGSVVFTPEQVGWRGGPLKTLDEAMGVGRDAGWLGALGERLQAWLFGVRLRWAKGADVRRVTEIIDRVEREANARGKVLNRPRFRSKIRRALVSWPRKRLYRIPVEG
jgi:hypothetical protein